jgi:hypothetical protein
MGYREYHISSSYKLYGKFHFEVGGGTTLNPFLATHRTAMAAESDDTSVERRTLAKFMLVNSMGVYAPQTDVDKLLSISGHLVVPDGEDGPFPLAVFIHGQSEIYSPENAPTSETLSYRGYRYLQRYLGDHGVASVSVNVNFSGWIGEAGNQGFEEQYRLQQAFQMLALLHQLSGTPVSTDQLISLQRTDDSVIPLQEALELEGTFSSRSPEGRIKTLKAALAGKLDLSKLAFMGHSRGATAVQYLQPFFMPRVGTAPTDYAGVIATTAKTFPRTSGPYNSNSLIDHLYDPPLNCTEHLYHHMLDLVAQFGNPGESGLKTVVSLQPSDQLTLFNSSSIFFLAMASSHDNDVNEDSFNCYEDAGCPKAMVFSHGASHGRFNSVWRRLPGLRASINRDIMGQSPIRMLSNRGHQELAKATIGNAILAGLLAEDHRYGFFTGEIRAPSLGQDITRAWKYPYPFSNPPAMRLLDATAITAVDATTSTAVTIRNVDEISDEDVDGDRIFANKVGVKAFTRPAGNVLKIRIPIVAADGLATKTHLSFRYCKAYKARESRDRQNAVLRNYSLRLKSVSGIIGTSIAGADVPSIHHRAYPAKRWSIEVGSNGGYYDATYILLQTAEVPLSQFLSNGQPQTDLTQVNTFEIQLEPNSAVSGDETFYFVDFMLVTRNLPAAPTGFAIP